MLPKILAQRILYKKLFRTQTQVNATCDASDPAHSSH